MTMKKLAFISLQALIVIGGIFLPIHYIPDRNLMNMAMILVLLAQGAAITWFCSMFKTGLKKLQTIVGVILMFFTGLVIVLLKQAIEHGTMQGQGHLAMDVCVSVVLFLLWFIELRWLNKKNALKDEPVPAS